MTKTKIRIRRPDDFHVHLRQGDMLGHVVGATAMTFGRALVMPNTTPPIRTGADAMAYKASILDAQRTTIGSDWSFEPLMTIKLLSSTTPEIVREAHAAGVVAAKLYPAGVTTNSDDGIHVANLGAIAIDRKVLDRVLVSPALAVDHLLVRQHRLALGAPVHLALLAIG